jgi:hypothetical protein
MRLEVNMGNESDRELLCQKTDLPFELEFSAFLCWEPGGLEW